MVVVNSTPFLVDPQEFLFSVQVLCVYFSSTENELKENITRKELGIT